LASKPTEVGGLNTRSPHHEHEHRADRDLDPREEPGIGEHREGPLVDDREDGVEKVPDEDEGGDSGGLHGVFTGVFVVDALGGGVSDDGGPPWRV